MNKQSKTDAAAIAGSNMLTTVFNFKSTSMEKTKQKIDELFEKATEVAMIWVRQQIQYVFENNKGEIDECALANGSLAFYKNNEPLYEFECDELDGFDDLNIFICEYEDSLHLSGIGEYFKPS
jgi:hypothetical protein